MSNEAVGHSARMLLKKVDATVNLLIPIKVCLSQLVVSYYR